MRNKDKINTRPRLPHVPVPSFQAEIHSIPNSSAPSPGAQGRQLWPGHNSPLLQRGSSARRQSFRTKLLQWTSYPGHRSCPESLLWCGPSTGLSFLHKMAACSTTAPSRVCRQTPASPCYPSTGRRGISAHTPPYFYFFPPHTSVPCGILPFLKHAFCEAPPAGMRGSAVSCNGDGRSRPEAGQSHPRPAPHRAALQPRAWAAVPSTHCVLELLPQTAALGTAPVTDPEQKSSDHKDIFVGIYTFNLQIWNFSRTVLL